MRDVPRYPALFGWNWHWDNFGCHQCWLGNCTASRGYNLQWQKQYLVPKASRVKLSSKYPDSSLSRSNKTATSCRVPQGSAIRLYVSAFKWVLSKHKQATSEYHTTGFSQISKCETAQRAAVLSPMLFGVRMFLFRAALLPAQYVYTGGLLAYSRGWLTHTHTEGGSDLDFLNGTNCWGLLEMDRITWSHPIKDTHVKHWALPQRLD